MGPKQALVVTDFLFTDELASICAQPLIDAGWQVDFRAWAVPSIEAQRTAVRQLENDGPDSVSGVPELGQAHDYSIIVTQFSPVSAAAIANGTQLELIAINRSGMQNIAVDAARSGGVDVFNVPGRNANAVAEHTLALMLAHLRFVGVAHAALKAGSWLEKFPEPGPRELAEVTVGLIGYGLVGRRVHELLRAFNATVMIHDPFVDEDVDDAAVVDLDVLLAGCDVVSLHAPLNDTTRAMVGAEQLGIMKSNSILVNTARAELIDQVALRDALANGTIGGAALDVFDKEPLDPGDSLIASSRTTLTPHLAGTTRQAFVQGPVWIAERLAAEVAKGR